MGLLVSGGLVGSELWKGSQFYLFGLMNMGSQSEQGARLGLLVSGGIVGSKLWKGSQFDRKPRKGSLNRNYI